MDKRIYSTARFILPSTTPCAKMSNYRISFNNSHDVCIIHLRGVAYNAELLTQAVSSLVIDPNSLNNNDLGDETDDEVHQQNQELDVANDGKAQIQIIKGDAQNVEEAAHRFDALDVGNPKGKCTPRSPLEWLDLGVPEKQILLAMEEREGSASSDMKTCPEDEEFTTTAASYGSENANITTPKTSFLRSWILEDLSDQVDEFYNNLPSEFHEDSQKIFARFFSVANVEWSFMSAASRHFRELGSYVPKRLEAANYKMSSDGSWKNCPPSDPDSSVSVPAVSDKIVPPFHHLNFLGHPVHHKSSTPAEVSLWLASTSHKKHLFDSFSRQGVITSQATKLIDPFVYFGQEDVLEQCGTQLRNAVVGLVEKAYDNQGTWLYDGYDEDEEVPRNADWNEGVWRYENATGELQAPHWMSRYDCDDTIINDGKGSNTPKPSRRNPDSTFRYTPSRIRVCAELEAAEDGARKEVAACMLAVRPFLEMRLNFHATSEEQVEEVSETREEKSIYIPCLLF